MAGTRSAGWPWGTGESVKHHVHQAVRGVSQVRGPAQWEDTANAGCAGNGGG